jgi:hypothetical protein
MKSSEELPAPTGQPQCVETSECRLPANSPVGWARLLQMSHRGVVRKVLGFQMLHRVTLLSLLGVSLQKGMDP